LTFRELYSRRPKLTDNEIIDGIRLGDSNALKFVYEEYFQSVYLKIVKGKLLNKEDARDIFHQAMIIVYDNVRMETFVLKKSFAAFLFAVCKKLTLMRLRFEYNSINNRVSEFDLVSEEEEKRFDFYPEIIVDSVKELKYGLFYKYFSQLKQDCKEVLKMAYSDVSYDEIAIKMGYKKGTFAKSKKNRCLGYLVKSIKSDKLFTQLKNEK
jgi:RNA polymerase sigma factor (sigma-70 family)